LLITYQDLLSEDVLLFLTFFGAVVTALVAGISFHEFCHAVVADRLGDRTARLAGRVSLNPARHLDPFGSILLLIGGFGWGKPVPVSPTRLRNGPQAGRAMVAAAGPLSNLLLAAVASVPVNLGLVPWRSPFVLPARLSFFDLPDYVGLFLASLVIFNVILAVFNLLPLAPLDGFAVALGLLPRDLARSLARLEQYGPLLLVLLISLPFLTRGSVDLLPELISPAINAITEALSGRGARAFS
jgi:Zn-dependent protease